MNFADKLIAVLKTEAVDLNYMREKRRMVWMNHRWYVFQNFGEENSRTESTINEYLALEWLLNGLPPPRPQKGARDDT